MQRKKIGQWYRSAIQLPCRETLFDGFCTLSSCSSEKYLGTCLFIVFHQCFQSLCLRKPSRDRKRGWADLHYIYVGYRPYPTSNHDNIALLIGFIVSRSDLPPAPKVPHALCGMTKYVNFLPMCSALSAKLPKIPLVSGHTFFLSCVFHKVSRFKRQVHF